MARHPIRNRLESSLGQRLVKALPQIAQESPSAGFQFGQKVVQEVLHEMQQEYPDLLQGPKPAPSHP